MSSTIDEVKRHWQLWSVLAAIAVGFVVIYALRGCLFTFILGAALANVLSPVVSFLERKLPRKGKWLESKRLLSIGIIYVGIIGLAGVLLFFVYNAVINAFSILLTDADGHFTVAVERLQTWTESIRQTVNPELRGQMDNFIEDAGLAVTDFAKKGITNGVSMVPYAVYTVMAIAVLPFFLFYLLKDRERLGSAFYSGLPGWAVHHTRNIVSIITKILTQYVRASLTLGLVVGLLTWGGLVAIGVPEAALLAVVNGTFEIIPTIGPWIGGLIGVIVTLALAPDKVIWVILLYLAIQLLENSLIVPRVQAAYMGMHPAITIVVLVASAHIGGVWGMIFAIPMAAMAFEIYRYIRRVVEEDRPTEPKFETSG